jgi:hypothetical protein
MRRAPHARARWNEEDATSVEIEQGFTLPPGVLSVVVT